MASEKRRISKEARKLAEKEAKKNRKKAKRKYKRELKKEKLEAKKFIESQKNEERAKRRRKSKRKYKIKVRFIILIILIIAALAAGGFFAVKSLIDSDNAKAENQSSKSSVINVNEVFDSAETTNIAASIDDILSENEEDGDSSSILNDKSIGLEYKICAAIISDWHISPLTQTRKVIEETFGELYRYEDWNGGIYYHRGFPETMYITYNGDVKGEQPASGAICDSVSICLKNIIEFDEFTPDHSIWGKVNKTDSEEGWTKYFYSIIIKNGVDLIVYCDKDGKVDKETHIIVRKV